MSSSEQWLIDIAKDIADKHKIDIRSIVDAGANDLEESIALHKAFPEALIHAYEPNPSMMEVCREKARSNPHIAFYAMALGSSNGAREFLVDGLDGRQSSFYVSESRASVGVEVPCEKLKWAPDLLWMDVQGAEHDILYGMGDKLGHVLMIVTELMIQPLYRGCKLFDEVDALLSHQFRLVYGNPFEVSFGNYIYINKCCLN